MFCIVLNSWLYALFLNLCVCILLWRYLLAAYLCWVGWLEVYGIMVSVKVGFLKMDICVLYLVLFIKFIMLFDSISVVKCRFGCVEFKTVKMDCILVWVK
jgi:hypothetical protein